MERLVYMAHDGKEISYVVWDKVKAPKAIILIVHGMAEHIARYDHFATFLNSEGYIVLGDDHRGHGYTEGLDKQGITTSECWDNTVKDLGGLSRLAVEKYKLPLFVLGHSYGSFLTQRYIQKYSEKIKGAVLSGSAWMGSGLVKTGQKIANLCGKLYSHDKPAKLIAKMSFGSFNKPFKESGLLNSWLSRDEAQVIKYNEDPMCGYVMSVGFQVSFFEGVCKLYDREAIDKIDRNLPLYIISGAEDPVGERGGLVKDLYQIYKQAGMKSVDMKLYPNARHEILNESNKEEVYADVLAFFNSNLA